MAAPKNPNRRIAIIGSNGQLGADLMDFMAGSDVVGLTHSQIDITQPESIKQALDLYKPHIVINTAAFNRVDDCELHPEEGLLVNAAGVCNLAYACRAFGAALVHFSTDYVFDGLKTEPYNENDLPNPISAYGISKLAGELFAGYILDRYFVIRTCGLYGKKGSLGKGGNFVETMLRLGKEGRQIKVVNDQTLTPTFTLDLAQKVAELITGERYGLYHITSAGECTWYDFALKVFEFAGIRADVQPISSEEYGSAARRPRYSVLQNLRLVQAGIEDLRPWEEALRAYLAE